MIMSSDKFRLIRCVDFGPDGIGGVLTHLNGSFSCLTLELPWRNNQRYISCVPAGIYMLEPRHSMRFGNVLEVKAVSGRSDILIHSGNTYKDTNGCILPGRFFGKLNGLNAVLASRSAMEELNIYAGDFSSTLEIINKVNI